MILHVDFLAYTEPDLSSLRIPGKVRRQLSYNLSLKVVSWVQTRTLKVKDTLGFRLRGELISES
jgi:hypothetical protein